MRVVITGANGLLGHELLQLLLKKGHDVVAVVRRKSSITELPPSRVFEWDAMKSDFPKEALSKADAIVHLIGDPIMGSRWTEEKKTSIVQSRLVSTKKLVAALTAVPESDRPKTLLSGSAVGFYGNQNSVDDPPLDEQSPKGNGFLADLCRDWENEAKKSSPLGLRLVLLRTAMVLAPKGGALEEMKPVIISSGRQWMSWVHIQDWVHLALAALENPSYSGPLNLCSPHPVTNAEFTKTYAHSKSIPFTLKAPAFAIRIALGEMAGLLIGSQKVVPTKALKQGYTFQFPDIHQAFAAIQQATDKKHTSTTIGAKK